MKNPDNIDQEFIRESIQRRVLLYKRRFPRTTSQVCDEYYLSK